MDLDFGRVLADKLGHFLVEDFDDVFSPRDSWGKLFLQRAILDSLGELEDEFDVYVCLQ